MYNGVRGKDGRWDMRKMVERAEEREVREVLKLLHVVREENKGNIAILPLFSMEK